MSKECPRDVIHSDRSRGPYDTGCAGSKSLVRTVLGVPVLAVSGSFLSLCGLIGTDVEEQSPEAVGLILVVPAEEGDGFLQVCRGLTLPSCREMECGEVRVGARLLVRRVDPLRQREGRGQLLLGVGAAAITQLGHGHTPERLNLFLHRTYAPRQVECRRIVSRSLHRAARREHVLPDSIQSDCLAPFVIDEAESGKSLAVESESLA